MVMGTTVLTESTVGQEGSGRILRLYCNDILNNHTGHIQKPVLELESELSEPFEQ